MQTTHASQQSSSAAIMQSLAPLERWVNWKPHLMAPEDASILKEEVRIAFQWLSFSRLEFVRYEDAVSLAQKSWVGVDRLLHERFAKHVNGRLTDDGATLRCSISALYQGAHAQSLWADLVYAPAHITIKCTLSEIVRLLLFYGTCFKSLEQAQYHELEPMLRLYEHGCMPLGLASDHVFYVITG